MHTSVPYLKMKWQLLALPLPSSLVFFFCRKNSERASKKLERGEYEKKKLKFHENVPYDLDFCDSNLLLFCGHYQSPFILEA